MEQAEAPTGILSAFAEWRNSESTLPPPDGKDHALLAAFMGGYGYARVQSAKENPVEDLAHATRANTVTVMGITRALTHIEDALNRLADAAITQRQET